MRTRRAPTAIRLGVSFRENFGYFRAQSTNNNTNTQQTVRVLERFIEKLSDAFKKWATVSGRRYFRFVIWFSVLYGHIVYRLFLTELENIQVQNKNYLPVRHCLV